MASQCLKNKAPVDVLIIAVPETAGSALYGMLDVLLAAGNIWETLVRDNDSKHLFQVRIISTTKKPFSCGNSIPVKPEYSIADNPKADIIILPEIWLGPDECISGRYPQLMAWVREKYKEGSSIYSACSGTIMLAESGLLDGRPATSHWGYQKLFKQQYPKVDFHPEPNLVFADPSGRIVTAGGTTSWHDLALHIISRYCSPGEALKIAKVYLLKWHGEGQLPYTSLLRNSPHADAIVRSSEAWMAEHFHESGLIQKLVDRVGIPERTLKRRFKNATGTSLMEHIQYLRIEEAKHLLETDSSAVDEISVTIGYDDPSFFRRLFKRLTGLTPSQYRRMFRPITDI